MRRLPHGILRLGILLALAVACRPEPGGGRPVLRLGHFPTVTHAQGLVAHQLSRQQKGWFEERLGMPVEWYVFNAGPSAMEALLAGSLDATYVGPSPALNAHLRSRGAEVRVLAGAARGGAGLVVREAAGITSPEHFRGRRVATPQLGNTQDVACRAWLGAQGFRVTITGGDVQVIPTPNPDQLALFRSGALDAAWTVEPWISRLVREGGGRVFLLEEDTATTVLVAAQAFVAERPELARRLAASHTDLTAWMTEHATKTRELVAAELLAITRQPVAPELLEACWSRLRFDPAVRREDFEGFMEAAHRMGLLPETLPLERLLAQP